MKIVGLPRLFRRLVLRYFGSVKAFLLFVVAIALTAYCADIYLFARNEDRSITAVVQRSLPGDTVTAGFNVTPSVEELRCGVKQICPVGKYPFHVKSGYLEDGPASICFRGKYYVGGALHGRGISLVVVNDEQLKAYLRDSIPDYRLVLMTTEDEASRQLSQEARVLIHGYGSDAIHKVLFRENFAMVGQKGLSRGTAIEQHVPKSANRVYGEVAEVSGCLNIPVGRIFAMNVERAKTTNDTESNCGVVTDCGTQAFPVRMHSGMENRELPKICVNGHYVLQNEASRGINVVIVDPLTKSVINASNFDTYSKTSESFVPLLRSMKEGNIVIAVTHDEATTGLEEIVRAEFEALGSSYIRRLAMRDAWAFVGQKGLKGRSTIEELEFAPSGGGTWSNSIDKKLCVPLQIKGFTLKFDAVVGKNVKRDDFCSRHVGFGDFCSSENRFEALNPAPLTDQYLAKSRIFNVPLLIAAGVNKNVFRQQLEVVLSVPGIKQKMVKVFYNESVAEYAELVELFGFNAIAVSNVTSMNDLIQAALTNGWAASSDYVILLEEEVFPTADFFSFLDQCLEALDTDDSLIGVSAWNDNGYVGPSNNVSVAYRLEVFPGLGFMLKRSFFDKYIRSNWSMCCGKRSWEGWLNNNLPAGMEMIVPEISRVTHRPYDGLGGTSELRLHLFNRRRTFSNGHSHRILNSGMLLKISYEADLRASVKSAVAINVDLDACFASGNPEAMLPPREKSTSFAIFYTQQSISDEDTLSKLCQCFQLFSLRGHRVRGTHHGLVRFTYGENQVFLIGSSTEYFSFKPPNHEPMKMQKIQSHHQPTKQLSTSPSASISV